MTNNLGKEIENYIKKNKITISNFARNVGYDQGNLSKVIKGELKFSKEKLKLFIKELNKDESEVYANKLNVYYYIDNMSIPEEFYRDESKINILIKLFVIFFTDDVNIESIKKVIDEIYNKIDIEGMEMEFLNKNKDKENISSIEKLYNYLEVITKKEG